MKNQVTRLDYCQYLLVSQINYTLTNFADHSEKFSHDQINRYLRGQKITPRLVWENVKKQVVQTENGYLIFDDTVADKSYSSSIKLARRQYSGNAHHVINGIGIVTCVYVNPEYEIHPTMNQLGIQAIYPQKRTTVRNPEHQIYPYLLRELSIEKAN